MKGKTFKLLAIASMMLSAVLLTSPARAAYVEAQGSYFDCLPGDFFTKGAARGSLFARPTVVWGTSLKVDSLVLASAGTVTFRLTDLDFPQPLETLNFLVTDLNGLWQRLDTAGDLTIDLTGPAKLFVAVFAKTHEAGKPGLYALTSSFAPVPLPAAAWLLLSGLGGLALLNRKKG